MLKHLVAILLASSSFAESSRPFKIGVIAALSGQAAGFGTAVKNGVELSQEGIKKEDRVSFIFEDDQYNPTLSVSAYRKLRQTGVDLIFVAGVAPSMAVAPLAERDKFPLLVNCQSTNPTKDKHWVISSVNPTADYVELLWKELRAKGYHKIGIIEAESAYVAAYIEELKGQKFDSEQVNVLASVSPAQSDFRAIITNLKRQTFDILGVLLFPGQLRESYKQLKQANYNVQTFGTDVMESEEEQRLSGDGIDGAVYVTSKIDPEFELMYRTLFKNIEQISTAANSFEIGRLLQDLFSHGSAKSEEIIHHLRSVQDRKGVLGIYSYQISADASQHYRFPLKLVSVRFSAAGGN